MNILPEQAPTSSRFLLINIVCLATVFCLWGMRKDLPYVTEADEETFVTRAVNMAGLVDVNPFWFGNPGTTTYPLAIAFRVWNALSYGGSLVRPDRSLQTSFHEHSTDFFLLGRLLSSLYAVLSVVLIYQIGRNAFDTNTGLLAAWFSTLCPLILEHAQVIRLDTTGLFFALLAILLCLKLLDHPYWKYQILAGLAVGFAIASRMYLVSLICVLAAIDLTILAGEFSKRMKLGVIAGFLGVVVGFVITSPYLFLDSSTALAELQKTSWSTHLGADRLTPWGNLLWYLTYAVPASLTLPVAALTLVGAVLVALRRQLKHVLLLTFILVFLGIISIHPLHWQRWLIQFLPIFSLFAASAFIETIKTLSERFRFGNLARQAVFSGLLIAFSAWPLYQIVFLNIRQSHPSTRVVAREWILQNLPSGSRIAQEAYTAPLDGAQYKLFQQYSLAASRTLEDYRRNKFQYLIVSSSMYERYFAQPDRYPSGFTSFYKNLFERENLVKEFIPSTFQRGPIIRVYALDSARPNDAGL